MTKQEIRDRIRRMREDQDETERWTRSDAIVRRMLSLDILSPEMVKGRRISLFFSHKGEPEMLPLYHALTRYGAKCFYPVVRGHRIYMAEHPQEECGFDEFVSGELGIPEPDNRREEPADMDIVIIPGIAFSELGQRIGYGKGYYDRYLAEYPLDAMPHIIAPAFEFQIVPSFPTIAHDVPVDVIVTEDRILWI
jgi:5-formyltetrahydrofolate cyclo-ligase